MARSDLIKRLFKSYKSSDPQGFEAAAKEIIDDEKKKNHAVLAIELLRILEHSPKPAGPFMKAGLEPLPKDGDRGSHLIELRNPEHHLEDLILRQDQYGILKNMQEEFKSWEVLEAHRLRPSNKLLFCGPPGCGKTVTAEALANALGLPLLYVRFDAVVSSLLGETASNLRKVFDYASKGAWVLLFDEFDAIGRSRDDMTEHGELKRVVNAFLQMLDSFTGRSILIAATNFEQSLDPALWRRFDEIIRFEKPDREEIQILIDKRMALMPHPELTTPSMLEALDGMSYAEIERLCFDVLKQAVLKGKERLSRTDMDEAIKHQMLRRQALSRSRPHGSPIVD